MRTYRSRNSRLIPVLPAVFTVAAICRRQDVFRALIQAAICPNEIPKSRLLASAPPPPTTCSPPIAATTTTTTTAAAAAAAQVVAN